MASLTLNCFPGEISPSKLKLPYIDSADWDESRGRLEQLSEHTSYRFPFKEGVRAILISGPKEPYADGTQEFDVGLGQLGARIIDATLARHLRLRGMDVSHTSFETAALTQKEVIHGVIGLYTGIAFKARKPFRAEPQHFIVSVQWKVSARFVESLAHPAVGVWCENLPVIYKAISGLSADMGSFHSRYLGRVLKVESPTVAVVRCRDGVDRRVPLVDLYPEGSPQMIREYENRIGARRSVWRRIQQLSFVLNDAGRRNVSVLRDRLDRIRVSLGGGQLEKLVISVEGYEQGSVTIGLVPMSVPLDAT
jgi:hypothetical protein